MKAKLIYPCICIFLGCSLLYAPLIQAQVLFGDACVGIWQGTMHIYNQGVLKDSVGVRLTVAKTKTPTAWTWKTEYLSSKQPVIKDYTLRLIDADKHRYVTDEGGGLELTDYLFGNKLYSVFETQGILLTSTYELRDNALVFEVTSGKKRPDSPPLMTTQDVTTFSVDNLQQVVLKRVQ